MTRTSSICAICAWRETCKKKFQVSGRDTHCVDFTRDLSIKDKEAGQPPPEENPEEEREG